MSQARPLNLPLRAVAAASAVPYSAVGFQNDFWNHVTKRPRLAAIFYAFFCCGRHYERVRAIGDAYDESVTCASTAGERTTLRG